jgi:hypothetical protein
MNINSVHKILMVAVFMPHLLVCYTRGRNEKLYLSSRRGANPDNCMFAMTMLNQQDYLKNMGQN